jgi:hypothetical protein
MLMDARRVKRPFSCTILIFLHVFLGIGAVFGGLALTIDPSGNLIHMPVTLLEHSPFRSFLIPGVILLVGLGAFPLLLSYALITGWTFQAARKLDIFDGLHWAWNFSLYIGFALIIWISVQVFLINAVDVIHIFYIALGLAIQATTLLPSVQKYYTVSSQGSYKI